ncbi:MAG: ATP-binding cassette domain-containing protein [Wenzhouxiangella sp.]|nr:MAG: ATP-binding cassette domain-containing protein [Wenzhouxiangella sp.]
MGRGHASLNSDKLENTQALVSLEGLSAGYTGPVVGPVSFSVQPGEVLGLGGLNGAGKSTVLRALTGTARVFSGRIVRAPRLSIAHHQQRPERPPELPLLGRELLALLDADPHPPALVQPLLDRPLSRMSGGQYQLLQAWACLNSKARLVLLDEPTNNLDGTAIEALGEMLATLGPGRAAILVSHEQAFLDRHCARQIEVSPWTG